MPVISMRIDEKLLKKLDELSKKTGKKRSQIIKDILRKELKEEKELTYYLEQMKKGKKTGNLDLETVEKWLSNTKPEFEKWEEAIKYSRQRTK